MDHTLNDVEIRVLGALIEKEITTPDYYPLSLNALVTACNQTSNRSPVTHFDEETVRDALDSLRKRGLVHLVDRGDTRVIKHRHVLYEAMSLGRPAIAVLGVLMLRGPQTIGEIRTRTSRLYDFASLEAVETTLQSLIAVETPLIVRLPRQIGQKEVRYAHLLSGEVIVPEPAVSPEPDAASPHGDDRVDRLERDVEELKRQFAEFRKQFE